MSELRSLVRYIGHEGENIELLSSVVFAQNCCVVFSSKSGFVRCSVTVQRLRSICSPCFLLHRRKKGKERETIRRIADASASTSECKTTTTTTATTTFASVLFFINQIARRLLAFSLSSENFSVHRSKAKTDPRRVLFRFSSRRSRLNWPRSCPLEDTEGPGSLNRVVAEAIDRKRSFLWCVESRGPGLSSVECSVERGSWLAGGRVCHCSPARRVSDSPSSIWTSRWSDEFEEKVWPRHSVEDDWNRRHVEGIPWHWLVAVVDDDSVVGVEREVSTIEDQTRRSKRVEQRSMGLMWLSSLFDAHRLWLAKR